MAKTILFGLTIYVCKTIEYLPNEKKIDLCYHKNMKYAHSFVSFLGHFIFVELGVTKAPAFGIFDLRSLECCWMSFLWTRTEVSSKAKGKCTESDKNRDSWWDKQITERVKAWTLSVEVRQSQFKSHLSSLCEHRRQKKKNERCEKSSASNGICHGSSNKSNMVMEIKM